eukprot:TRINITY_DN21738_c0_g3_i1.p1 TRINITY_DN21738_c0_g3~~TRINITY_DN21738_c0_g3_i1.p1  ORF type:complete len:1270 (+),score=193.95 TRINITY_DN21738_c0_g3_i1:46-3810(+)
MTDMEKWKKTAPRETGSCVSKITYSYVSPLLSTGYERPLTENDLPKLAKNDKAKTQYNKIKKAWKATSNMKGSRWRYWKVLYEAFFTEFIMAGVWSVGESTTMISQPVLLAYIITWIKSDTDDYTEGIVFSIALALASFLQAIIHHQLYYHTMRAGWCIRMGTTSMLHQKLLRTSYNSRRETEPGKIFSLISTDVLRYDQGTISLHFSWVSIIDMIVVYVLLSLKVGWGIAAIGVGVLALCSAVQFVNSKRLSQLRQKTAVATDARVNITSQSFSNVLTIKASTWEKPFTDLVHNLRSTEAKCILKSQFIKAFNQGVYFSGSIIAAAIMFTIYSQVQDKAMEVDVVYPCIGLLQVLRHSLGKKLSRALETIPEMDVSNQRIQQFLEAEEGKTVSDFGTPSDPDTLLELNGVSFSWSIKGSGSHLVNLFPGKGDGKEQQQQHQRKLTVSNLTFSAKKGQILAIQGPVASGKSTILSGILREASHDEGSLKLQAPVAYCSQNAWITFGTVRDNILFGLPFDKERYETTIQAAALAADLKQLQNGDQTEIGERGVNLSGGQKARVSLARALYSDAKLLLLDDPLSAVDPHVCTHILKGLRSVVDKSHNDVAVILVTHQQASEYCDVTVTLNEDGTISSVCDNPDPVRTNTNAPDEDDEEDVVAAAVPDKAPDSTKKVALIEAEDRNTGVVELSTYTKYAEAGGVFLTIIVALFLIAGQACMMLADYWLSKWAEDESDPNHYKYPVTYASLCAAAAFFGMTRAYLFFFVTIRANTTLHDAAYNSVISTKLAFFTANPLGRILNRFSADLGQTDELLPVAMFDTLQMGCLVLGSMTLVIIAVYYIGAALPFLVGILWYLRRYATASLRELKRMDGITKSPVYTCFAANLAGITSIKAYQREDAVQHKFEGLLEKMALPWYWWFIGNRWLGFRLDLMCATVVTLLALFGVALRNEVSSSLYALAMTYAMSLSEMFQFMVRQSSLVETFMTSVERLQYYGNQLPVEEGSLLKTKNKHWPENGNVSLTDISVRYRSDLPVVLKNVSATIPSGSRVGVVGRTGSGKSSFFQALLGMNELVNGDIVMGADSVLKNPLMQRRKAVTFIPQEPVLFTGTVRYNLDPFNKYTDADLKGVLKAAQLSDEIKSLSMKIEAGGVNLSMGHRQLFSLARAMLKKSKLLLIDEATANVDFATDAVIQEKIRTHPAFRGTTIFTIAHRIDTISDSDLIMVFDNSLLVECDSPAALLANPDGVYAGLHAASLQS